MSANYALARDSDSSRLALLEALKRPHRLNTAQRYRLEAEAAYQFRYDLPAAVRWYELHLEHAPQSGGGYNNMGVYLASLGRYEEALDAFRTAADSNPFGPAQSQIQISNVAAMLLALGRMEEARKRRISSQVRLRRKPGCYRQQRGVNGRGGEPRTRPGSGAGDSSLAPGPGCDHVGGISCCARGCVGSRSEADDSCRRCSRSSIPVVPACRLAPGISQRKADCSAAGFTCEGHLACRTYAPRAGGGGPR